MPFSLFAYRLTGDDFGKPDERSAYALRTFEKMLVLSDGCGNVVGGILFYGKWDLQAMVFPEYRGRGFMSAIHRNGVLKAELDPDQRVTIDMGAVESREDLEKKLHLLGLVGLKPENGDRVEEYVRLFDCGTIETDCYQLNNLV